MENPVNVTTESTIFITIHQIQTDVLSSIQWFQEMFFLETTIKVTKVKQQALCTHFREIQYDLFWPLSQVLHTIFRILFLSDKHVYIKN